MTLRHFHLSDAPGVNRLHRAVWWPERSPEGWRWLDENPARQALDAPSGWVIEDSDGAPAAFLGNFVQRFWRGDRLLYGATGFSIIVPPDHKGRSRDLIQAFVAQPGCFALYTLNANARSSPLYQRFGMTAWPAGFHCWTTCPTPPPTPGSGQNCVIRDASWPIAARPCCAGDTPTRT